MRGEEKPYEMPIAEEQEEDMEDPAFTVPTVSATSVASAAAVTAASAATATSAATSAGLGPEKTKQKLCKNSFTNNFAIQQRLQHLSPVHPKSLTVQGNLLRGIDNKTVRR